MGDAPRPDDPRVRILPDAADVIAPDGSEVRELASGDRATMAHFSLGAGAVSLAVAHRSIEELWFVIGGAGRIVVGGEEIALEPGTSLRIPPRTRFQFRAAPDQGVEIVAATVPPWPGADEAEVVAPYWPPTVGTPPAG